MTLRRSWVIQQAYQHTVFSALWFCPWLLASRESKREYMGKDAKTRIQYGRRQ
jgi:hypothetical protein